MIKRCIDGEINGAIPSCPEQGCTGKLKLENGKVTCGGGFNEEMGTFIRCYFSANASSISRLPWRNGPKTEGKRTLQHTMYYVYYVCMSY